MAKKKTAGNKKAKQGRPSWMSDAVFELSQSFPRLVEHFIGNEQTPCIDCNLAGILIWQKIYSTDKKSTETREEAVKLGVVENAVKILSSDDHIVKTPAVGILGTLFEMQSARDLFFGLKSQPMMTLLSCLEDGNPCLAGYTCRAIAKLANVEDSKLNVMKAFQDWNWSPLVKVLLHQKSTSMLGGDFAASDASIIIQSVCCEASIPENTAPNSYKELCHSYNKAVIEAEAIEAMTKICLGRYPNWCKVSIVEALRVMMKGPKAQNARTRFVNNGGREAMAEMLKNAFFTLKSKAAIAECLCISMLRNSKNTSKDLEASANNTPRSVLNQVDPSHANNPSNSDTLLDLSGFKTPGVIGALLELCLGPDGPLPDEIPSKTEGLAKARINSAKKRKGKGAKKKAMKLEPGMAEAQSFASGCLRIMSSDESVQREIVSIRGIQSLTPLLTSKVEQARWNAREILLNLATLPEHVEIMVGYGLPNYITQSNIPRSMKLDKS